MDFVNQAAGQLRELMLSMTPAARVTAVLLLGVIVVSMGYLVQHQTANPDDYLFNGEFLPVSVLNRAEAAIAQAGLTGYVREGGRIRVPRDRKGDFLAAVADAGALPPNFHNILEDALDVSPFASGETRRDLKKAARERQLSMLVSDMAGIEQANVMFEVREKPGLSRKVEATATVSVRPSPGTTLDARQIKRIRQAVAGGVLGLKPDQVAVTNASDGSFYDVGSEVTIDTFDNEYYQTRVAFEQLMKNKIEAHLAYVPGATVEVTAELETVLERTSNTVTPEDEPVTIRESKDDETNTVSEIDNGGRPGLTAQGPTRNNEDSPTVTVKSERVQGSNQSENIVGQKNVMEREAALVPRYVRTAIAVPTNYLKSVARERLIQEGVDPSQIAMDDIVTRVGLIKDSIRDEIVTSVALLLPKRIAENNLSEVKISFFESLTPDPVVPPSMGSEAFLWASKNFNTLTMAVVALVSLMMLRSMVKAIPAAEPSVAFGTPTLALETRDDDAASAEDEEAEMDPAKRPRLKLKKGDSLKDDLVDIVREDPDAAAAILRSWIGNAG